MLYSYLVQPHATIIAYIYDNRSTFDQKNIPLLRCGCQPQLAMLDSFLGQDQACEFFYLTFLAFNNYYLETIVMVNMYMLARKYYLLEIVLNICKVIKKLSLVMIINYINRANHGSFVIRELMFVNGFSHEVFQSF